MTQNALNNTIGSTASATSLDRLRNAEGQWDSYNDGTDTFGFYNSTGTPEGGVTANIGSLNTDTTNGLLYIKTTDSVNTGWKDVGVGKVLQMATAATSAYFAVTTVIPQDDTIPQNTEGDEIITVSITPKNSSNILYFVYSMGAQVSSNAAGTVALFQDATAGALAATMFAGLSSTVAQRTSAILTYSMTAGTTSSTTFKIRAGPDMGSMGINGSVGREFGGVAALRITVFEVQV